MKELVDEIYKLMPSIKKGIIEINIPNALDEMFDVYRVDEIKPRVFELIAKLLKEEIK